MSIQHLSNTSYNLQTTERVVNHLSNLTQSPQNPKLPHSPENVTQPLAETPKSKLKVYINLHNQKPLKENHEMFTWEDGGDRFPVTDEDYACLNKDQLLNDSIIEYFKEMDQYAKKPLGSTRTSTNHRNWFRASPLLGKCVPKEFMYWSNTTFFFSLKSLLNSWHVKCGMCKFIWWIEDISRDVHWISQKGRGLLLQTLQAAADRCRLRQESLYRRHP